MTALPTLRFWRDQVELIADRGREILKLATGRKQPTAADLAMRLLRQRGEASGLALASELIGAVRAMDAQGEADFLEVLNAEFSCDPKGVDRAITEWKRKPDAKSLAALAAAVESPRQELFRRLNMAPNGTAAILHLRECLLKLLPERPHLLPVDNDLRHLLASWFNRGFLRLEVIDWNTPAAILEKLIAYEAVHEIKGWDDLRGRLAADRRCFAFFHPALPDEPLIFVEVALVNGLAEAIGPLIDPAREIRDPRTADTAIFYSISNCQDGLRGISFGNFLLKQVVGELSAEFPQLDTFSTLSPLPGFAKALRQHAGGENGLTPARIAALIGEEGMTALRPVDGDDPAARLAATLAEGQEVPPALRKPLQRLALAYLMQRRGGRMLDPVAHFHLSNGARLERINLDADLTPNGHRQSFGVMVNYLYDPKALEVNHERYVDDGEMPMSRRVATEAEKIAPLFKPR